ncbi:MAG: hypothetical protein JXQ29_01585 [Planctomycetes bacterium]|nr:hypothetical protein [Planctomycetota bacterium]
MSRNLLVWVAAAWLWSSLLVTASAQTLWTGQFGSDWFTPGNWSAGLPTATVDATIPAAPGNQPVVTFAGAACRHLTVETGATLVLSGGTLTVSGVCTNAGTLTFSLGTLQLASHFTNTGTLNPGTGTLLFFNAGSKNLVMGTAVFNNLIVSAGLVYAKGSIVAATLVVNPFAAIDLGAFNHTIAGDCNLSGGVTGTGELILTGSGDFTTSAAPVPGVRVTGGVRTFGSVTVSKNLTLTGGQTRLSGGTVNVLDDLDHQAGAALEINAPGLLDVGGNVTIAGSFTMPAGRLVCRGNWTSGASFRPAGGLVQFTNGPADIQTPGSIFRNVEFLPVGTKTLRSALDVNGSLQIAAGGTVDIGAFTHTVGGGFESAGAVIGSGWLELDGDGRLAAAPHPVARVRISAGTVTVSGTAGVSTELEVTGGTLRAAGGTLTVDGLFSVAATAAAGTDAGGSFDLNGAVQWDGACVSTGGVIRAAAAWASAAAFRPTAGAVELDGVAASFTNLGSFHALRIASGQKTTGAALDVNGGLAVDAGASLELGSLTHAVSGGLVVEGAVAGAGAFDLDGPGDLRVTTAVCDVTVSGGPVTVDTVAHVDGKFRVTAAGAFAMAGGRLAVKGDVTFDRAVVLSGGVVELAGGAATLTASGGTFHDLAITGGLKSLADALAVGGQLSVAAGGSLDLGSVTHRVGGGLTMAGTLSGAGLLDLNGPGTLLAAGLVPRLKVSGGPVVVTGMARIGSRLEVTSTGRLDVQTGGELRVAGAVQWDGACASTGGELRVEGDFTATGTGFAPAGGAVVLDGTASGTLTASGAVFQTLEVAGGQKRLASGPLAFDQALRVAGGVLTTAGGTAFSAKAGAVVQVLAGGTLRLHGASWRDPVVAAGRSGGRWSLDVQGTLGLRYFAFSSLDGGGVQLRGELENDPDLGNGVFDDPVPGGACFTVTVFGATRTLRNVYFRTDPGSGGHNVRYTAAAGKLVFENAIGAFKGAAHESDPGGRVDWVLGPTAALRLTEIFTDAPLGVEVTAVDVPVDLEGRILGFGRAGAAASSLVLPARVVELDTYLELREGSGASGPNCLFLGVALPWASGVGGFASLRNAPAGGGVDFVRWGGSTEAPPAGTAFVDGRGPLPAPAAGQSLGRDMFATDTDTREDWEPGCGRHATFPTRGARNVLFGVPYVWQGGETLDPFAVDAPGAANLWHVDTHRSFNPNKLKHEAGPPPDVRAWAFHRGAPSYNYDTGARVHGGLRSPAVRLPDSTDVRLSYFEWLQTEDQSGKDECRVEMRELGATSWISLGKYTGNIPSFTIRTLDISALKGKDVEFRWTFDSVDSSHNAFEGWCVDYVAVYEAPQGLPFMLPEQNGPPPPPPPPLPSPLPRNLEVGDVDPAARVPQGAWFQPVALRFVLAGPDAVGLEVTTGTFAVRPGPGEEPGTWQDVVALQGVPPALAALLEGEPYPEFRFPLPILPGLQYRVEPVQIATLPLPVVGLPQPVPDRPAVELVWPGPVLVVRPFGQDAGKNPEQRYAIGLRLRWQVAR